MSKAFKSGELLGKGILDMTKVYSQQSAQEFLKGVVAALSKVFCSGVIEQDVCIQERCMICCMSIIVCSYSMTTTTGLLRR